MHYLHILDGSPLVDQDGNPQHQVALDGAIMHADDARLSARWLTSREAQAIVSDTWEDGNTVPISSITHACRRGHIRGARKEGRDWLFRERELWDWLNHRPKPGPKAQPQEAR